MLVLNAKFKKKVADVIGHYQCSDDFYSCKALCEWDDTVTEKNCDCGLNAKVEAICHIIELHQGNENAISKEIDKLPRKLGHDRCQDNGFIASLSEDEMRELY